MSDLSRFVQIRPDWSRFRHDSSHNFLRLSNRFWLNARPPVSRVLYPTARVVSRIGWRPSIWDDGYPPPRATYPEAARDEPSPLYLVLLQAGLAQPAGHPTAGALLPHHLTLTAAPKHTKGRVGGVFLCAFRQVTLPGSYPAPCPAEPGLSSTSGQVGPVRRPRPPGGLARSTVSRSCRVNDPALRWPWRRRAG